MDINALNHALVHNGDYFRDNRLGNGLERDESLEGAQRDIDYFRILRGATHKHRAKKVFRLWTI